MNLKLLLCGSLLFLNVFLMAMEEQKGSRPMPFLVPESEIEKEDKYVILELVENEKLLYSIRVPYSFAQESSVIKNLLQFQEEEEGKEPTVQFDSSVVTLEQLKALRSFVHENYLRKNLKQTVQYLVQQWYPNNIRMLIDLIYVSNFIGNERLFDMGLEEFTRYLKKMLDEQKFELFFQIPAMIKILDVQDRLKNKIIKNQILIALAEKLYSSVKKISIHMPMFSTLCSGAQWLAGTMESLERHGFRNYFAKIVDLQTQKTINEFPIRFDGVNPPDYRLPFKISHSGKYLAIASGYRLLVYSISTGELFKELQLPSPIRSLYFSADDLDIGICLDNRVLIVDALTFETKKEFAETYAQALAFSVDTRYIAFNSFYESSAGNVKIWDLKNDNLFKKIKVGSQRHSPRYYEVKSLLFSPDNNYLIYALANGEVKILHMKSKFIIEVELAEDKHFHLSYVSLAFSPDSKLLARGFSYLPLDNPTIIPFEREVKIWDIQNRSLARTIPIQGADRNIYEVSFSPDGKNLAYIGEGSIYNQGNLYIMKVSPKNFEEFTLQSSLLLWYFAEQSENNQPLKIPRGYFEVFNQLPKKIRRFFHERNIELGESPASIPYIYPIYKKPQESPIRFLKEKRKEREEEAQKKRKEKRPFKKFKTEEYLQ